MRRKSRSADVEGLVTHPTPELPDLGRMSRMVVLDRDDTRPDLPTEHIDPAQLLGLSLVIAVGISLPSLSKAVQGRVTLLTAAWYFGWAVIVSLLGVWLLWAVWHAYRRPIDEQLRRDWEQARAERLEALEAENLERLEANREAVAHSVRAETEALRTAAPPDTIEVDSGPAHLPQSLRDALAIEPADLNRSVALSDPLAGSR
ncbi:MAG: hypothetical protein JWL70_2401 [Acidimicrobiia bacterium]|nr:hypothetical protein [Acidimicrobiia bacterium]